MSEHTGPTPERAETQHPNTERRDSHGGGHQASMSAAPESGSRKEWMDVWTYLSKH